MIRPLRILKAIIEYPIGAKQPDWNGLLAADVERRRNSFEIQDYSKRRAAALKGRGRA